MVQSEQFFFVEGNLDHVPDRRGVYELFSGSELIYIGRADRSLVEEIKGHLGGHGGVDPSTVSTFRFAMTRVPWLRYDDLVAKYREEHHGRLPRAQSVAG